MMLPLHRRQPLLGALISTQAQGTYYGTYVGPGYDLLERLHVDTNTLILSRSDFQAELNGLYAELNALDVDLSDLDSTNESLWTAKMNLLQTRLHEFTDRVAKAKTGQSIGLTITAGLVAFGTTWAFTKRIPRVRRSIYASGAMVAGGGLAQYWWRNRG